MFTVLLVVGILVFLIVVHELGHFVAAKLFHVKVEEFGLGYPPRALYLGSIGETAYTVNWIPFGGFVRLFGESEDSEKLKGSFIASPRYAQAVILLAGVTMNAIAAWGLFAGALYVGIPHAVTSGEGVTNAELLVSAVLQGSPASAAGLQIGDHIISMVDESTQEVSSLTPSGVVAFVRARGGKPVDVTVARADKILKVAIFPAHAVISEAANRPALGIGLVLVANSSVPPLEALNQALPITIDKFRVVLRGFGTLYEGALQGAPPLQDVAGPVGLARIVGDAAAHGVGDVLALAGFISVNLAIVNLLPIPALDGGRLALVAVETIIRRKPPRLTVQVINAIGIALIVALMVVVTYNDIARLLA